MVCDATESGRAAGKRIAPKALTVEDFDEVLSSPVPGVVIATPAETHASLALRALEAGKHIFVEKPLATSFDAASGVVQLAEELGRVLMVGHVLEYHPAIVRLLALAREGELGDVRYVYSNRLNLGKVRREENILWSFAPHDIAVILRLMDSMPYQVATSGGSYLQPDIADVTVTNLSFADGVRAHIYVSWLHPFKEQRLVIIGSRKMASFDDVAKRLVVYDQRVDTGQGEPVPIRGNGKEIPFADDEPLRLECMAFLEAMRSGRPPLTDGHSALRVLKVLQAAQRSLLADGKPATVAAETFARWGKQQGLGTYERI
jgi:predicted dehydrogenase